MWRQIKHLAAIFKLQKLLSPNIFHKITAERLEKGKTKIEYLQCLEYISIRKLVLELLMLHIYIS